MNKEIIKSDQAINIENAQFNTESKTAPKQAIKIANGLKLANGFILLYKPAGMSSMQAVTKTKYKLKQYYQVNKIGHTGTLDPFAEGLLLICVGNATKFASLFLNATKTYVCEIAFGTQTDTGDHTGNIINQQDRKNIDNNTGKYGQDPSHPTEEEMKQVLTQFIGKQMQKPHAFSAVHIKVEASDNINPNKQHASTSKRAYEIARKGPEALKQLEAQIEPKEIEIHSLNLLSYKKGYATLEVSCSSGTYVRVLAEDIAKALGTYGHLSKLIRTNIANVCLESQDNITESKKYTLLEHIVESDLYPLDSLYHFIKGFYPIIELTPEQAYEISMGRFVEIQENTETAQNQTKKDYDNTQVQTRLAIVNRQISGHTSEKNIQGQISIVGLVKIENTIIESNRIKTYTIKPYINLPNIQNTEI